MRSDFGNCGAAREDGNPYIRRDLNRAGGGINLRNVGAYAHRDGAVCVGNGRDIHQHAEVFELDLNGGNAVVDLRTNRNWELAARLEGRCVP